MANIKYQIKATNEQLEKLYKSLHVGSPLNVALSFAGIPMATYCFWQQIASVVAYQKEIDDLKELDQAMKSGASFSQVRNEMADAQTFETHKATAISAYREPSAEMILRYKNNKSFRDFANQVYQIIRKCDEMRSEIVLYHLAAIRDCAKQRGANSNASQWFLERTMPEYFGRCDRYGDIPQTETKTTQVKVEFVDPNTKESKDRVKAMENLVADQLLPNDKNGA